MRPSLFRFLPFFTLLAALSLGTYLRLAPMMSRDYWYDEAFTGITVRQDWAKMLDIVVTDVHPPFYYIALKLWTLVAGSSAFDLRFFSLVCGVATIAVAFVAMREWHKRSWWPAVIAAFAIAANPFLVNYSQEARMYALLGLLILLAAYLLTVARRTRSLWLRVLYGAVLLAAMLTHYLGAIAAALLVLVDLLWIRRPTVRWLASGYLVPFVGGIAWLPFFGVQLARTGGSLGWIPEVSIAHIPVSLHILLLGGPTGVLGVPPPLEYRFDWLSVPVVAIVASLSLTTLLVVCAAKRINGAVLLTALLAFVPPIATIGLQLLDIRLYVERYLVGSAVFLTLFLVLALARLRLLPAIALYFLLIAAVAPWQYEQTLAELTDRVAPYAEDGQVVYTDALGFIVARFYLGEQSRGDVVLLAPEPILGWALVEQEDQIRALPGTSHVLVTTDPGAHPDYRIIDTVDHFAIMEPL